MELLAIASITIIAVILLYDSANESRHNKYIKNMTTSCGLVWYDKCCGTKVFTYHIPSGKKCDKFIDYDSDKRQFYYFVDKKGNLLGGQYIHGRKNVLTPTQVRSIQKDAGRTNVF